MNHTNARPKGVNIQAASTSNNRVQGTPTLGFLVSHRDDAFQPIASTRIDTFKFTHTALTTVSRFDTSGRCHIALAPTTNTVATSVGGNKCTIDSNDPITDHLGNLAVINEVMPATAKQDLWAWTASVGTYYDNDVHATGASKITIETYP